MSRQGRQNFDNCPHKRVELVLERATLHCPKTEALGLQSREYNNARRAARDVKLAAAATICAGCVFAEMSPLGLADYQNDLAQKRIALLQLQAEALETERQVQQGRVALAQFLDAPNGPEI